MLARWAWNPSFEYSPGPVARRGVGALGDDGCSAPAPAGTAPGTGKCLLLGRARPEEIDQGGLLGGHCGSFSESPPRSSQVLSGWNSSEPSWRSMAIYGEASISLTAYEPNFHCKSSPSRLTPGAYLSRDTAGKACSSLKLPTGQDVFDTILHRGAEGGQHNGS